MSGQITRRLKPEEEELLHKHEELIAIRATLAERELDLIELRRELAMFEGRYLRRVGVLYAELDEWNARIAELHARANPSAATNATADKAREQARQTYHDAHGAASQVKDLAPSPDLKRLFREAVKCIHPDLARDLEDLERRTRFMADANHAYEALDKEALERILHEYQGSADTVEGEGVGAELVRIIRQIRQAKDRLLAIEKDLTALRVSEIGSLFVEAEALRELDRDLLDELSTSVQEKLQIVKEDYEAILKRAN
jgi:hypothetical protein